MNRVLILDFGSQYTQLIARKVRELGVYSEIEPFSIPINEIKKKSPSALILSGGPSSVLDENSPTISPEIFKLNIPILGICYGMQLTVKILSGKLHRQKQREYGKAVVELTEAGRKSPLWKGVPAKSQVWMSHGDSVDDLPDGFVITSKSTGDGVISSIENLNSRIFGLQFHPEVHHTLEGKKILSNFLFDIAGIRPDWTPSSFVSQAVEDIRNRVGKGRVVLAVSGGVDSTVLAVLLHESLPDSQFVPVFVDTGLLREGEVDEVVDNLKNRLGVNLKVVNAKKEFLSALKGVVDPEEKRKIIGRKFVEVFFRAVERFDFLAQGTLYPDQIESVSVKGPSSRIKTHHNKVDEIYELEKQGKIIEPLKFLFKDEVRKVGKELGIPDDILNRHPFPGPGLAVRIIGEITEDRLEILRKADKILRDEIKSAGIYDDIWQAFAVLLPVKSVGVMGDDRSYENVVALRMVDSVDGMTADWFKVPYDVLDRISARIVREVKGVNRVVYDITSKPPATIEWE